jgi:type I restriction enzyme S subunit
LYPEFNNVRYVSIETYESWFRGHPEPDDLIFVLKGTPGRVCWTPKPVNFCIAQDMVALRANSEIIYPKYLFAILRSEVVQQRIESLHVGSLIPHFKKGDFDKLIIPVVVDKGLQKFIGDTYYDFCAKTELNNKINQELENLAQTLFKRWFVDFDFPNENGEPYKSSGGEMVDSELGEIPKDWSIFSMGDLLETVSKTYPLRSVDEVVFLNTGDIQDGKFLHQNLSNSKILPGQAKKSIKENDILFSEIRPENKRFAFVHFDSSQYVVSTKLMVLRSRVSIHSLFQYFILTQSEQINYLQQLAESRSGTFPQITFSEVSTIKIALPNFNFVNLFVDSVLKPFFNNKFNTEFENSKLTKLRDTLLPKLISGELEVN